MFAGDAQVREAEHLLVDHPDAAFERLARCGERQPRALPGELAGVGTDDPGQDLQQRRLAGAVLADERMRLALARTEKVTPVSACTAPNDLRTSRNSSPGMLKAPHILLRCLEPQ